MSLIDWIGWIGSAMVIMAYAMNMYKKLASDDVLYYLLNIIGSACLIVNTLVHQAIPSTVVNIIWVLIAMGALGKKVFRSRQAGTFHKQGPQDQVR